MAPGGDGVSWDRYAYSRNNPVKYVDPDGHFAFVPFLIAAGLLTLKAVDYGWTAYDIYQAGKVLNDPSASSQEKEAAAATIATAIAFEAAEPDDALPGGLPLDDIARKTAKESIEGGVKKIPNSNGKKGGSLHQDNIKNIMKNVEGWYGEGFEAKTEVKFFTPGGAKPYRFADVVVYGPNKEMVAIYQVGKSTQQYAPVSREIQAINDIYECSQRNEIPIHFIPYNQ